jgi:hypothetical protein
MGAKFASAKRLPSATTATPDNGPNTPAPHGFLAAATLKTGGAVKEGSNPQKPPRIMGARFATTVVVHQKTLAPQTHKTMKRKTKTQTNLSRPSKRARSTSTSNTGITVVP